MNAASYGHLRAQQVNLSNAAASFYEARLALIAYRNALQSNYHAQEEQALISAFNSGIDKLKYLMNACNTLREQLIYAEQMQL